MGKPEFALHSYFENDDFQIRLMNFACNIPSFQEYVTKILLKIQVISIGAM